MAKTLKLAVMGCSSASCGAMRFSSGSHPPTMRKMAKRVSTGDLFAIPRMDGKSVLGQVLQEWMKNMFCIAIFDCVIENGRIPPNLESKTPPVLAMPSVVRREISGGWPVIGSAPLLVDVRFAPHLKFEQNRFIGASWQDCLLIEDLVNAYYKLATWEPYPGRPGFLRTLLLGNGENGFS